LAALRAPSPPPLVAATAWRRSSSAARVRASAASRPAWPTRSPRLGGWRRRRRSTATPAATAASTTAPNPAAVAFLPRPFPAAVPAVPVTPPDQEVPAAGTAVVWAVPEATPATAGASAWSREEGGSSVVASVVGAVPPSAEAVSPAGRPLEDASVV
jgi:hypothetical protein